MVILQGGEVIVFQSQLAPGLNQKVIVQPVMVIIVDRRGNVH